MSLIPERALKVTFCLEYSPNVFKQYKVRVCGDGKGVIDKLENSNTEDAVGYGHSFEEAFDKAVICQIHQKEENKRKRKIALQEAIKYQFK